MEKKLFSTIQRESLPSKIVEVLKKRILDGTLRPGTHLVETELAKQMMVSRAPLREALRILERSGLVTSHPNRGTFVTEFSDQQVEELYSLRSVLEGFAVRLSTERQQPEEIVYLKSLFDQMEKAALSKERAQLVETDMAFHEYLWQMSKHSMLIRTLSEINGKVMMLLVNNMQLHRDDELASILSGHRQTLDAIVAGDSYRAGQLIQQHIDRAAQTLLDYIRREKS